MPGLFPIHTLLRLLVVLLCPKRRANGPVQRLMAGLRTQDLASKNVTTVIGFVTLLPRIYLLYRAS